MIANSPDYFPKTGRGVTYGIRVSESHNPFCPNMCTVASAGILTRRILFPIGIGGISCHSNHRHDPTAPLVWKPVEEMFRRYGPILHIVGQVIRTTAEHPFHVYNAGWTQMVVSALAICCSATTFVDGGVNAG